MPDQCWDRPEDPGGAASADGRFVLDIARLLSKIELPTELPEFGESTSAFEKLRAAQSVFNVRRVDGDVERGAELYEEKCRKCHGK